MMKNDNEMLLFHATCRVHVDYICRNNFDWIINDSRETKYGKGLCWARDSHDSSSAHAFVEMFLALVCKLACLGSGGPGRKEAKLPSACVRTGLLTWGCGC